MTETAALHGKRIAVSRPKRYRPATLAARSGRTVLPSRTRARTRYCPRRPILRRSCPAGEPEEREWSIRIRWVTLLTGVAGLTLAAPSGALAVTTIGSNLAGSPTVNLSCNPNCTVCPFGSACGESGPGRVSRSPGWGRGALAGAGRSCHPALGATHHPAWQFKHPHGRGHRPNRHPADKRDLDLRGEASDPSRGRTGTRLLR